MSDIVLAAIQETARRAQADLADARKVIAKLERERDAYRTRAQVAESGINRAVGAAHDSMPDYPWNTVRAGEELSSACWAWASSLKGASQACDDLRARIAQLESQIAVKDGALKDVPDVLDSSLRFFQEKCPKNWKSMLTPPRILALLEALKGSAK